MKDSISLSVNFGGFLLIKNVSPLLSELLKANHATHKYEAFFGNLFANAFTMVCVFSQICELQTNISNQCSNAHG